MADQTMPLTIAFRLPLFHDLQRFINAPDKLHETGGYQNRKRKWRDAVDEASRSITLDPDDIDWIRRQIANRHGGGWQKKVADIFRGQHPLFSRIPVQPR